MWPQFLVIWQIVSQANWSMPKQSCFWSGLGKSGLSLDWNTNKSIYTENALVYIKYLSVQSKWKFYVKVRAALLALNSLHNTRKDWATEGISHFDAKLSIWYDASVNCLLATKRILSTSDMSWSFQKSFRHHWAAAMLQLLQKYFSQAF